MSVPLLIFNVYFQLMLANAADHPFLLLLLSSDFTSEFMDGLKAPRWVLSHASNNIRLPSLCHVFSH